MDKERLWTLMNQQLDGVNSRAEEEQLRDQLESSRETRALMDELRDLNRELGSMKSVDHPTGFVAAVMTAIGADGKPAGSAPRSFRARFGVSGLWLYPLAAGLILGLLIGSFWQGDSFSDLQVESLYGTIGSTPQWNVVAREELGAEQVRIHRSGNEVLVEVQVESREPVELEFHFDSARLGFKGLHCPNPCRTTTAADTLRLHPTREGRHALRFELSGAAPASLQLHLRRSGLLAHQSSWTFDVEGSSGQN